MRTRISSVKRLAPLLWALLVAAVVLRYAAWPLTQRYIDPNGDPRAYPASTTRSLATDLKQDGLTLPPTVSGLRFESGGFYSGYPDSFLLKFTTSGSGLRQFMAANADLCGTQLSSENKMVDGVQEDVRELVGWQFPLYTDGVYGFTGYEPGGRFFEMNIDDRSPQSPTVYLFTNP